MNEPFGQTIFRATVNSPGFSKGEKPGFSGWNPHGRPKNRGRRQSESLANSRRPGARHA